MKKVLIHPVTLMLLSVETACTAATPPVSATMPPEEWDYVVLGDSITAGYRLTPIRLFLPLRAFRHQQQVHDFKLLVNDFADCE